MALNFKNIKNASLISKEKNKKIKNQNNIPFEHTFKIKMKTPKCNKYLKLLLGEDFDTKNLSFFDTETTGLSGGAGTVIFLAGIGFFEGEDFVVKQYFIDRPGKEVMLIESLRKIIEEKNIIVSYNGKSFDVPLLKSRAVMNRVEEVKYDKQIDLLHCARFIWKNVFCNCKLTTLEQNLLNLRRTGDIPGQFIPAAYRDFLLRGITSEIEKIIYHNREDIVTLGKLLNILEENSKKFDNLHINLAISKKLFKNKEYENCLEFLREIMNENPKINIDQKKMIFKIAADCLKKQKKYDEASKLWKILKTEESYLELAKYFEHKKKDFEKAKEITNYLRFKTNDKLKIEKLNYRLKRLNKKLIT